MRNSGAIYVNLIFKPLVYIDTSFANIQWVYQNTLESTDAI